MTLKLIDDPLATQMLNSLAMELGALETATRRIRTQLDALLTMLTAEPAADHAAEEAGHPAFTGGDAAEALVTKIAAEVVVDEARRVEPNAACSGLETSDHSEFGEISSSDAAVIGLCARIEASVAEFAAAAEVAHASVEVEEAVELPLEVVVIVDKAHEELEPVVVAEASEVGGEQAGEVVAASAGPIERAADELTPEAPAISGTSHGEPVTVVSDEVSDPVVAAAVEIEACVPAVPANSNIAVEGEAVAADAAAVAGKVVVLEVKRRVWPQRLAGCASVLLVAAAAVVVFAMPEMMGIAI